MVKGKMVNKAESDQPVPYRETQNPAYAGVLSILLPIIMLVAAYFVWAPFLWMSILFILIAAGMLLTYGGFHTTVTADTVSIKMGFLGISLLSLKTSEIVFANIHKFSPIRDFGGYGIRFNRDMQAFFLKGDAGVKITTTDGKQYLIGSGQPERLLAAISAVSTLSA
jgi:hypothetical protein